MDTEPSMEVTKGFRKWVFLKQRPFSETMTSSLSSVRRFLVDGDDDAFFISQDDEQEEKLGILKVKKQRLDDESMEKKERWHFC